MKLFKFHATGNDFLLWEAHRQPNRQDEEGKLWRQWLCHRHFGIGADGIIVVEEKEQLFMRYYNSDGKEGSFCGNGARVFAFFCAQKRKQSLLTFEAWDGSHQAKVFEKDLTVAVSLQVRSSIKVLGSNTFFVDTGSPHYLYFCDSLSQDFISWAKPLRQQWDANVSWIQVQDGQIRVRTYERGVEAETYSCGTAAVAVAAVWNRFFNPEAKNISLYTKGGILEVFHEEGCWWLKGSVVPVVEIEVGDGEPEAFRYFKYLKKVLWRVV